MNALGIGTGKSFIAVVMATMAMSTISVTVGLAQPDNNFNGGMPQSGPMTYAPDPSQTDVSMTLYHVVLGGNGQQLAIGPGGVAIPLPGGGVTGHRVAVYRGTHGGTWYIDRSGQPVEIPSFPSPYAAYNNAGNYGAGSSYGYGIPYNENQQQSYQQPPAQATATASVQGNGGNNGGGFASSLVGATLGTALGDAIGGIPYGQPVYGGYGGGAPYYVGGGGSRTFVNNNSFNSEHFNEWRNQQGWYRNQFNAGGRYHGNYWPGKDHGFPRPGDGGGRLYADGQRRDDGGRHDDGGNRPGGGERHDGGGEHHDGGGGHHSAGGDHHAGGGHRAGGGHHGGGGHHK